MFTSIITDCYGENEKGRQIARYNSLGLGPSDLIGVKSDFSVDATIEGGADVIDILDAVNGKKGIIVLNVAPRGDKKDGPNGTHFSFFYYKQTLILSTIKGYCLSFIKKFSLIKEVNVVDLNEVLDSVSEKIELRKGAIDYILNSQFRSFDFLPRLARWLIEGINIPSQKIEIANIPPPPKCVWHIDAFGNAKLTILSNEVTLTPEKNIKTSVGKFKFYNRLKDVPNGETAIYTGSSGFGNKRFLELTTQGVPGSAAKTLNLKIGDKIDIL